jgi:hypothetical protein
MASGRGLEQTDPRAEPGHPASIDHDDRHTRTTSRCDAGSSYPATIWGKAPLRL